MSAAANAGSRLVGRLSSRPKQEILAASAALIAVVGVIDAFTGPDVSVLTFYFLPVLLSTWFVSRRAGVILSLVSAAEWIVIDLLANYGHISHGVSEWNAAIHLGFFVFGVWVVGGLKESMERQAAAEMKRMESEIETAREVQLSLLAKQPGELIRDVDVAVSCEPARGISGDFYDFIVIDEQRFLLVVADVSGKGVAAGLLGTSLLGGFRSLAPYHRGRVADLVGDLNSMLVNAPRAKSKFATLFAAEYDLRASRLSWVNAGHDPALLFRADSDEPLRLPSTGTVVGLFRDASWNQCEVEIRRGDTLVVFSDGVTEATSESDAEFGQERVIATITKVKSQPAAVIHRELIDAVTRFTGRDELADDRTVVVMQHRGEPAVASVSHADTETAGAGRSSGSFLQ